MMQADIFPWQQTQWQNLLARHKQQRMPHALLLTGPEGIGKTTFALTLAQFLLCEQPGQKACQQCRACHLVAAGNHPDLIHIHPTTGKVLKIEQIRELVVTLNQTAQQGGYQVAIIEPADALNTAAANALLKTLEEPPGKVVLLLITARPSFLPATIRSRCQRVVFATPAKAQTKTWLSTQTSAEVDLEWLLTLADNAPLKALSFLQDKAWVEQQKLLTDTLDMLTRRISPLAFANKYMDDANIVVDVLLKIFLEAMKGKVVKQNVFALCPEKTAALHEINKRWQYSYLIYCLDQALMAKRNLARNVNLNSQLLLESLLINIVK